MRARILIFPIMSLANMLFSPSAHAQTEMTLRQCIDYAYVRSNVVKTNEMAIEKSENDLSTAKGGHLPTVSAYATQRFDFGRGLTSNNTYENLNTSNTSFGIEAQVTLFAGFRVQNNVKYQKLCVESATANLQAAKEDLGINVASAYLQVLCAKEIAEAQKAQVELSRQQLDLKTALRDNGKASDADVAQARSLVAQEEMKAVQYDNDYRLALLDLSQALEMPSPDSISVIAPEVSEMPSVIGGPEQVYQEALSNKASVRAARIKTECAEKAIDIAKGQYWPTLSLSAGVSTGYYKVHDVDAPSFGDQMDQNLDKSIAIHLNVPIFNQFATRNGVREAKINRTSSQIELDNVQKTLYKEVQVAYYNALAAEATYNSSLTAEQSAEEAYKLAEAKYAQGLASATDYSEAVTNRTTAIATRIQYKYEMIFRSKILDFYRGVEIE